MKYVTIPLTALRSHPDLNPRVTTDEELSHYYDLEMKKKFPTYYISFTAIDKIGTNPNFKYNNPIGVYCYPLRFVYKNKELIIKFAGDRPFIQVLKLNIPETKILYDKLYNKQKFLKDVQNTEKIFNIYEKSITKDDVKRMYKEMREYLFLKEDNKLDSFSDMESITFKDVINISKAMTSNFRRFLKEELQVTKGLYIVQIWCITHILSSLLSKNYPIKWNILLRKLGYDMVLDSGLGFIHPNEPTQAVFLVSRAYEHVDTIENKKLHNFMLQDIAKFKSSLKKEKDGYRLIGNLHTRQKDNLQKILPDNLTIDGSLYVNTVGTKNKRTTVKFPKNLRVNGTLHITDAIIKEWPKDLYVGKSLDLGRSTIKNLPDPLVVNGDLRILALDIPKFPQHITVKGDLDLISTGIKKAPEHLFIGGKLDSNELFKVGKKYYTLYDLPDGATITVDSTDKNPILYFPPNWDGSKLPKNLTIDGSLIMTNTLTPHMSELPDGLHVKGTLFLYGSSINKIGKDTTVDGLLTLNNGPVELSDNLHVGSVTIPKTVVKLPKGLYVKNKLNFEEGSQITEIPEGTYVGKTLDIKNLKKDIKIPKSIPKTCEIVK